jgi:Domain of unknown function (DUF5134)
MIQEPLLRWVVTLLFVLSAAECAYALATGPRVWTHVIGQLLHFFMAVAMAVMAWPAGAALPTTAPMVLFLAATAWFVAAAITRVGHRAVDGYHAAMMLAMAWMYAVMGGNLRPGPDQAGHESSAASMPGMDMPAVQAPSTAAGNLTWIDALNWLCTIGFAVAAIWWLHRYFVERRAEPHQPSHRHLGVACQAMMAAGTAIMFAVML